MRRLPFSALRSTLWLCLSCGLACREPHGFDFDGEGEAPASGSFVVNCDDSPGPVGHHDPKQGVLVATDEVIRVLGVTGYHDDYFWLEFMLKVDPATPGPWTFESGAADAFLFLQHATDETPWPQRTFDWGNQFGTPDRIWHLDKSGSVDEFAPLEGRARGSVALALHCEGNLCTGIDRPTNATVSFDLQWDPAHLAAPP